jgi:Cytochrome c554 and c-prime
MIWIGTVALTACMFVSPQRSAEGLPTSDPHAFFKRTENCTCCHDTREKGTVIDPHSFSADIVESCMACHTDETIGQSHPVGVRANERFPDMEIPESLPRDGDERITCGTCHNPHLEGYTTERYASTQSPAGSRSENGVEIAYYKSYMLRLHAPDAGNDPTCAACHAGYF